MREVRENKLNRDYLKNAVFVVLSAITKLVYGVILLKVIAVTVTVKEFAYYGQIISFFSVMIMLSGAVLQNGLVKYLSPLTQCTSSKEYIAYINASLIIIFCLSFFSFLAALVLINYSKNIILPSDVSSELLYLVVVMQLPAVLSSWQLAINNSHKKPKSLFLVTLLTSIVTVALVIVLGHGLFELMFLSLLYHFLFLVFITVSNINDEIFKPRMLFFSLLPIKELKHLSRFVYIGLASFLSIQTAQLLLRGRLGDAAGWDTVGEWQVILRISELSLFFVTMFFSAVLYPSISSAISSKLIVKEYVTFFKVVYFSIVVGLFSVYLLKDYVILLLFDERYLGAEVILGPTLLGDAFRIASYAIGLLILLKGSVLLNLIVQFFQFFLYYVIAYFSIDYGLKGLSYAYPIAYLIYLSVVSIFAYRLLRRL